MDSLPSPPAPLLPSPSLAWGGRRRWLRRAPVILLGLTLSATLAASAFFRIHLWGGLHLEPRFPLGMWLSQLPTHGSWLAAFAVLAAAVLPLRALQWRYTLAEPAPRFADRYHAVAIGAFFHNAIPGKLGEFFRAFFLARKRSLTFFESLGSVLVCKLLELAALLAVVGIALAGPSSRSAPHLWLALALAGAFGLGLSALALTAARWALPLGLRLQQRPRMARVGRSLASLGRGLATVRSPRRMALAFLASFGPVLAAALAFGVALQGLGVPRGVWAGGVVLGAVSLGQLTPGLPIGTGMYYLTSSWAARALGAAPEQAAAFAALTHLASLSSQLLVGLVSLAAHRVRPGELMREREERARVIANQARENAREAS
ncbi:MAG: flippase-like domain-containing protein [Deltaproteobacteria bacterium]|nr:flippase-like domain-containing protein [Deltaproteobacteria bacterium]